MHYLNGVKALFTPNYQNTVSFFSVLSSIMIIHWYGGVNLKNKYGSGHETEAVLLPGFAINW